MAYRPITATPAKKGFINASMDRANRTTAASDFANIKGVNSNVTNLKPFTTSHKFSAYVEDSDTDDDGHNGGGAKLTPQPRGVTSEKTMRFQDYYDDYRVAGGGASLSAPRPKAQASAFFSPQTIRWGKSVAFANAVSKQAESETNDEHESQSDNGDDLSSCDGAETVATSHKTVTTGRSGGTQGSSPNTMMSPGYSTTTPKAKAFTGGDPMQFMQTVPAHFAPRPDSRLVTGAPPPAFDLASNLSNLVGQVIARATQSTPGSLRSDGRSPGMADGQPVVAQDVFQANSTAASPFSATSALRQRGNNVNADIFRSNNLSSPGSITSSLIHRDSLGSGNGISPSKLQRRSGYDISWEDLLAQTREAFSQLALPQVSEQPVTFTPSIPASDMLNMLTSGFTTRPAFDLATSPNFEPFIPGASMVNQTVNPVVKIDELPYEAKVSDIIAFVGGNAKILNDADEPVHIMMERLTAKTGAAYIEFYDFDSAMKVVDKHRQSKAHGKPVRINTRIVTVSIASQDQLLKDLFPYARDVNWMVGQPHIQVPPEKFKGFVTDEELIQLVKNIEFPFRVSSCPLLTTSTPTDLSWQGPYTKSCPQRSVETLISILKKLPWHMTAYITIRQRHRVYKTVVDMIQALQGAIYNSDHRRPAVGGGGGGPMSSFSEVLNEKLLKRLVRAAMGCPGFSPLMKDDIAFISSLDERQAMEYGVPGSAARWRHIYTLIPNPGVPGDVVEVRCPFPPSLPVLPPHLC